MDQAVIQEELRILMLEDTPADAELAVRELNKAGIRFTSKRVEKRGEFLDALKEFHPDIVLSDYNLPDFDGLSALKLMRREYPDVPVIMVTGALTDVEAVELIHAGARDYVLKDRRARLADAVQRVLAMERASQARMAAEAALRETLTRYVSVTENANDAIICIRPDGTIDLWNKMAQQMFGYSAEEALGQPLHSLVVPERYRALVGDWMRNFSQTGTSPILGRRQGRIAMRKDGTEFPVELSISAMEIGGHWHAIGIVRDITERKLAEDKLRIAAATFDSQQGFMITDADTVILSVNHAFTEMTGYKQEELVGLTPRVLKSERHDAIFFTAMWESIRRTGKWQGEIWDKHKDGRIIPEWLSISAVKNGNGVVTHYVGAHTELTERKSAEEKIHHLAFFDSLTGLPNRTLLLDRMKQAMSISSRTGGNNALLFIDLDNFKLLNDTKGHEKGDLLLQQVAECMSKIARDGDTVARTGGDEFMVMLTGLSSALQEAAALAEVLGGRILAALNQTFELGCAGYSSTASMGVTLFSAHQTSVDDLFKQADLAMYKAKEAGGNTLRFFDAGMEASVIERSALEADLRMAIEKRQFLLYYQPQIAGESTLTGVEALVRWNHPVRGLVPPSEFIPLAEETGLILPLGRWVLVTACAQLAAWQHRPEMSNLTFAVNVSAKQFRAPDFVNQVMTALSDAGADPQKLKLELTESVLVDDVQNTIEKMHALKAKGVSFSLDDFGTGYSSLSYLKRLPLDQLKIDRSFVRDVLTDPNDAAIARTIIALAASLGLAVIAEGVETAAQQNFLAASGCHAYQGYFFSEPLKQEGFEAFAGRHSQARLGR